MDPWLRAMILRSMNGRVRDMIFLIQWDTPTGRTAVERELDEFLLSLNLNPGPRGY